MPLRVWRSDDVTPLSPHPNDPVRTERSGSLALKAKGSEFLTMFTIAVPADAAPEAVDAATRRQADRARELAERGHLECLWALPGQGRALGLWQAADTGELNAILVSLPMHAWMSVQTTPLTPHPSDPALTSG
jgi:muconolactone delta-isomerase